jgi:hypothetical protein
VKRKSTDTLDVGKVIEDFQKAEESSAHRKGTFNIDKPFGEALDTILESNSQARLKRPSQGGRDERCD